MKRRGLLVGLVCCAGLAAFAAHAPTALIYNRSPSVPVGFYARASATPALGAFVTVRASAVAPDYAAARNYSDRTDRFIKRVAAMGGELVCAEGDAVRVGNRTIRRAARDGAGRALPRWTGCRLLRGNEVLLLGDTADSFDGRYWGPTRVGAIDGVWRRVEKAAPVILRGSPQSASQAHCGTC